MSARVIDRAGVRDGLLRFGMRADAVISGLFGLVGLAGWISEFTGATEAFEHGVDAFFVAYGVVVLGLATLPSVRRAGAGVVIANLAYTVSAVVLVVVHVFPLTTTGVSFTLASALYTLAFAQLQYLGWRRVRSPR